MKRKKDSLQAELNNLEVANFSEGEEMDVPKGFYDLTPSDDLAIVEPPQDETVLDGYGKFLRDEYPKLYPPTQYESKGRLRLGDCIFTADDLESCILNDTKGCSIPENSWAREYFNYIKDAMLDEIEEWKTEEFKRSAYQEYLQKQKAVEDMFWVCTDKGGLRLDSVKLLAFTRSLGFVYIKIGQTKIRMLVRLTGYTVEEATIIDITSAILNEYLLKYFPEVASKIWTKLVSAVGNYLLSALPSTSITFAKSTEKTAYFPFQNGVAVVTPTSISIEKDFTGGYFWSSQICKANLDLTSSYLGDWSKFLNNIGNRKKEETRYACLTTAIGYLLHSYQDNAGGKAIIITEDTPPSTASSGRTGKSLIATSLGYLCKVQLLEGRTATTARMQDKFVFQSVQPDTKVVNYDDANRKFPLELLFTSLTQGITIERKGLKPIILSLEDTPKFVITTNFSVGGVDPSSLARRHDVEIHSYYGPDRDFSCPHEEFKRNFWSEGWDEQEWNSFYCTMLQCVQQYLLKGLVPYLTSNASAKRLTADLPTSVLIYAQEIIATLEDEPKFSVSSTDLALIAKESKIAACYFIKLLKLFLKTNGLKVEDKRILDRDRGTFTREYYITKESEAI